MKFYKTTFELAQPSIQSINVPTDTSDYAVGVKIMKKGEVVTEDIDNLTLGGEQPLLYKNGYAVYYLSAGSDVAGTQYDVEAKNRDIIWSETQISEGGRTFFGMTSTISRTVSCDMQQFIGSRITLEGTYLEKYQDGVQLHSNGDYIITLETDGSDTTRQRITFNHFESTGGSYASGAGIYFYDSETSIWTKQPENSMLIDEHITRWVYTWFDGKSTPKGTVMKFYLHLGRTKVDGNFKLQVTHKDTGEGEIADMPIMSKSTTLSGWYTDGTFFKYNLPTEG